jgi:O-methyltransferase involved in polyketide biosynthesis
MDVYMAKKEIDSTGISITAYYTGEVWRRYGLSVPFLSPTRGSFFYLANQPAEWAAKLLLGGNNITLLLQRHLILDDILERAINEEGFTQIVEIACGLSPRGTLMTRKYPHIRYIEADLPKMAAHKRYLLDKAGELSSRHTVVDVDILAQESEHSLEAMFARDLDPAQKTLVITEGLVNYFELSVIGGFWQRLADLLKGFPAGIYLSDLYPDFRWHRSVVLVNAFKSILSKVTRSHVNLHFESELAIRNGFLSLGFRETKVHLPESYYGVLDIPIMRTPSLVRVIENRV